MKTENYDYRLPRLFVEGELSEGNTLPLDEDSAHYLKNVLRRPDGSPLRVFNGRQGEFMAVFQAQSRKNHVLNIGKPIRAQPEAKHEIHLVFALIKKDRLDFMIEKAVELGVTHFHPILTQQTVIRDLNEPRLRKQIAEAAEQCERLDCPQLLPLSKLENLLAIWPGDIPLFAGVERENIPVYKGEALNRKSALLIGPEGGFSDAERELLLKNEKVKPVSFGETILRAETAALYGLSLIKSSI